MPYRMHRGGTGGNRLNGMILISLLFHALILALLFLTPSFPSPKLTFGPVYTVSLVNFSGHTLEQKSVTAVEKELMESSRPETIFRKKVESDPILPIRSVERSKKQDQTVEKAMEEIRKRASMPPPVQKQQDKVIPGMKIGTASPTPSGDAGTGEKMNAYYAAIWSRIKGRWALPQAILPGEVLETVVHVTILRSGAVTEINFEKRSGNRYFDESALKAIRKAIPFPPLPAGIGDGRLDVGIRFHSSELRP